MKPQPLTHWQPSGRDKQKHNSTIKIKFANYSKYEEGDEQGGVVGNHWRGLRWDEEGGFSTDDILALP